MIYTKTEIPDLWLIEPMVYGDERGYFMEVFKKTDFQLNIGTFDFVQDNESRSTQGVWRGLHYQLEPYAQAKLVRVIQGTILDVAVDIRIGSPTFGKFVAVELSGDNKHQLFIPKGFAHGFYVMSDFAVFIYKVDNPYMPAYERAIRYNDPFIGIDRDKHWGHTAVMSDKDRYAPLLSEAENNFQYQMR